MGFEASVYDVAPTILYIYGIEKPAQMRGHVISEIFEGSDTKAAPVFPGRSPERPGGDPGISAAKVGAGSGLPAESDAVGISPKRMTVSFK